MRTVLEMCLTKDKRYIKKKTN